LHVHYFDEDSILYRQILYPTPANWPELKAFLNTFGESSINLEGYIQSKIGNVIYRGLMDYIVTPSNQGNGQLPYQAIGDNNGDNLYDIQAFFQFKPLLVKKFFGNTTTNPFTNNRSH